MAYLSKSVLLTGAHGFTGRLLVPRLLSDGYNVVGVRHAPSDTRNKIECPSVDANLLDRKSLSAVFAKVRPSIVIHLAGISVSTHTDPGEIYAVNVAGTVNLLSECAECALMPEKIIVASSAAIYGAPENSSPVRECAPAAPINHYGASKAAMELAVRQFMPELPIIITRPFNYTGPGQGTALFTGKVVHHFVNMTPRLVAGDLSLCRDISDVNIVVETYLRLIEKASPGTVVNIASGRAVRLADIVTTMVEITNHQIEVQRDPSLMRRGEPQVIIGSREHLDSVIGPLEPLPIEETLRRMYDSARAD